MYEPQNNTSIEIDNTKETEGYLYLIQPDINQPIFKIGGSQAIGLTRLKSYGKTCKVFSMKRVLNTWITEKKLIKCFNEKFTRVQGREYFTGCLGEMLVIFEKICVDNLPDYSYLRNLKIEEEKPKQPEKKKVGRPKKFDITKFSGEELLKAQEEEERKRDAREAEIIERRRVAYEKRLEKLKQQRAEKNAKRGRPKIEKAPKPKKEKPEKPTTELKPKEVRKLFLTYRNSVLKYGRDDLFAGGERERLMLINIIEKNSNLTRDELVKTYKDLQNKVTDIPKFLIWLDSMIFAIYIRSNELGERIRIAESGRGVRNDDDKDPRPEYLSFIKDDYEKNSVEYWTVFNYYRLKTGNWSKSMKML